MNDLSEESYDDVKDLSVEDLSVESYDDVKFTKLKVIDSDVWRMIYRKLQWQLRSLSKKRGYKKYNFMTEASMLSADSYKNMHYAIETTHYGKVLTFSVSAAKLHEILDQDFVKRYNKVGNLFNGWFQPKEQIIEMEESVIYRQIAEISGEDRALTMMIQEPRDYYCARERVRQTMDKKIEINCYWVPNLFPQFRADEKEDRGYAIYQYRHGGLYSDNHEENLYYLDSLINKDIKIVQLFGFDLGMNGLINYLGPNELLKYGSTPPIEESESYIIHKGDPKLKLLTLDYYV